MNRTFSVFRSIGLARVPYFYSIGKPNSPLMAEMGAGFQIASGRFWLVNGLKRQTLGIMGVNANQAQRFQEVVVHCTCNSVDSRITTSLWLEPFSNVRACSVCHLIYQVGSIIPISIL